MQSWAPPHFAPQTVGYGTGEGRQPSWSVHFCMLVRFFLIVSVGSFPNPGGRMITGVVVHLQAETQLVQTEARRSGRPEPFLSLLWARVAL